MRRVLMVSPHFPPDTSAGTHRVRLLAPHLAAFGWEPTVVTVETSAYEGRLDPDLEQLVPQGLRVIRVPAWPASITRRIGLGDLGLRSFAALRRTCRALLANERFDALFITMYPTYPAVLGPGLKARYDVPFVLDYQDPWVGAWGLDVGGGHNGHRDLKSLVTRSLGMRLEPRVVRGADALTAVSARTYEDVLARVRDARPRACAAIPLGFEEADFDALRRFPRANPYFNLNDGCVHVCYVGTVLPMGIPVLRSVLAAVAQLRRTSPQLYGRLRLHFFGTSNQRDTTARPRVLPLARELGIDNMVTEVPARLDYLDALNVQVTASALLLLGSTEPHYTPSKVFPALLSGRPLIGVYHEASSVVDLLRAPCVDAHLATFTDDLSLDAIVPLVMRALQDAATTRPIATGVPREVIAPWSAHALAGRLAGVLDTVTA